VEWAALKRWTLLSYLDSVIGHRTVPIEVGSHVGKSGWHEELLTIGEFLRAHVAPSCTYCAHWLEPKESFSAEIAYLAQHELLDQCPALRADLSVPDSWRKVLGKPTRTNVWLGTHGTVTPCHWDSYDNILAQAQGAKRVILFSPHETPRLYADKSRGGTSAQGNVSQVDVEAPDLAKFPEFGHARSVVAELGPGDALYIPRGWWHQVRALTPSCSVNFWF